MDETDYLHTLDIEAYEAALAAAVESLKHSDLGTPARLQKLAEEDGVVGEAASQLVEHDRRTP